MKVILYLFQVALTDLLVQFHTANYDYIIDNWMNSSPTGVENGNGSIPKTFALLQNYPNPFNPSTVITYNIPQQSNVSLKIYDILGKEIATLG